MDLRIAWRHGRQWLGKEGKILRYSLPLLLIWIAISQFIDVKGHWTAVKNTSVAVAEAFEKVDPWLLTKQFYGRLAECRYDWRFTCLKPPEWLTQTGGAPILGIPATGPAPVPDRPGCYTVTSVVAVSPTPPMPGQSRLFLALPSTRFERATRVECVEPRSVQWWPFLSTWLVVGTPGTSLPALAVFWLPQSIFGAPDAMWQTATAAMRESAAAAVILAIVFLAIVASAVAEFRRSDNPPRDLLIAIVLTPLVASVLIYLLQGGYWLIGQVAGETMASVNSVPFLIAGIVAFPKIHKGVGLIHAARRLIGRRRAAKPD